MSYSADAGAHRLPFWKIDTGISKKKEDGQILSNTLAIMRTKEERPSVKDVKHSDEVERENFVMEKTEFLPNVQTEEKKENAESVQSNAVNADMNAAAQGHGYAAEQANNLYDILTGKDAKIVGGDNAKDGPDRMVNVVNIQTKYCHDAASSVQAAFENG